MRNGIFPVFAKGRVLKKESIEYLRDFPHDLASLARVDYSDGILFGFSVSFKDGYIFVSKGALKYQGNIIIVQETIVPITEYGSFLYIKLVIGKCSETEDYKTCPIEIKIDENELSEENAIELGRFCLNPGAVLRCKYDSFNDLRTPENTLDITRVSYAGYGTATLHPIVLKEYARALMATSTETADFAFALMCINSDVIHKNSIQWYIAKKNDSPHEDYTVSELYEKLVDMLPKHGRKNKPERSRGKGPSIS